MPVGSAKMGCAPASTAFRDCRLDTRLKLSTLRRQGGALLGVLAALCVSVGIVSLFSGFQQQHIFPFCDVGHDSVIPASQRPESCPPWNLERVNVIYSPKY